MHVLYINTETTCYAGIEAQDAWSGCDTKEDEHTRLSLHDPIGVRSLAGVNI